MVPTNLNILHPNCGPSECDEQIEESCRCPERSAACPLSQCLTTVSQIAASACHDSFHGANRELNSHYVSFYDDQVYLLLHGTPESQKCQDYQDIVLSRNECGDSLPLFDVSLEDSPVEIYSVLTKPFSDATLSNSISFLGISGFKITSKYEIEDCNRVMFGDIETNVYIINDAGAMDLHSLCLDKDNSIRVIDTAKISELGKALDRGAEVVLVCNGDECTNHFLDETFSFLPSLSEEKFSYTHDLENCKKF